MICRDCVFCGTYQDMGASCDVCNLQSDLVDAIEACENSAGCRHRFTVEEAKQIVYERAGRLPAAIKPNDEPRIPEISEKTMDDAFAEIAEIVEKNMHPMLEAIKKLDEALKEALK